MHRILPLLSALPALGLCSPQESAADEQGGEVWTQEQLEAATRRIQGDVERLRGAKFLRPVEVRITDQAGFLEHALERVEKVVPEGTIERDQAMARMLALVPPDMDVWAETLAVLSDAVGGFYDPGTDTFYLMESFTGKLAEIILAHELTHALDDQLFGIDRPLVERAANADASSAFSAVVEGSGTALMGLWTMQHIGEIPPEELAAASELGAGAMASAPPYLWKPMLASYLQGQRFLNRGYRHLRRQGKSYLDVVAHAFAEPPLSTEQVLHPEKYWDAELRDDPRAIAHRLDALPVGWEPMGSTVFGELLWALVVADESERAPPDFTDPMAASTMVFTNEAATGWDGDQALLLARGAARVLHVATLWDDAAEAAGFRTALEARRGGIAASLAALDADGAGSGLLFAAAPAPDGVTFTLYHGLPEAELPALLATLAPPDSAGD
ncbi:MAG: hypothetical protein QF903_04810 [Planctomycetota bacterium]|jgi:hypothetical protein|nr:hypothetical protein [Planctomycetota bacterium]MDP6763348.1 hypothetical protein [Planctomycetota bacterium]MDP6988777.1 hypothetical protein [Planctomycetota bacterium]